MAAFVLTGLAPLRASVRNALKKMPSHLCIRTLGASMPSHMPIFPLFTLVKSLAGLGVASIRAVLRMGAVTSSGLLHHADWRLPDLANHNAGPAGHELARPPFVLFCPFSSGFTSPSLSQPVVSPIRPCCLLRPFLVAFLLLCSNQGAHWPRWRQQVACSGDSRQRTGCWGVASRRVASRRVFPLRAIFFNGPARPALSSRD